MTRNWRLATRKRNAGEAGWDIGMRAMTASNARSVARQLNIVYPEYEHKAVFVAEGS
jgi:hypothetical protein